MKDKTKNGKPTVTFSERQLEVLACWGEVAGEEIIADRMGVSKHTVHTHLRRARQRIGAKRTFDAYKYALDRGWLKK